MQQPVRFVDTRRQSQQPGAEPSVQVEALSEEDEEMFIRMSWVNTWAKRVMLGLISLFVLWVVYKFATALSCVQTIYDTSFACRVSYSCDPPRIVPCTDPAALIKLGADSVREGLELGRANSFWPYARFLICAIANLRGVAWVARVYNRVRLSNDSWVATLFTLIAIAPDLLFAAFSPYYTDAKSLVEWIKAVAWVIPFIGPLVSFILMVWPLAATCAHHHVSVYGTLLAMQKVRGSAKRAVDLAKRGLNTVRDTTNTVRETASAAYNDFTAADLNPIRGPVVPDTTGYNPLPSLSPQKSVNWGRDTHIPALSSFPSPSAPTLLPALYPAPSYPSSSSSQWNGGHHARAPNALYGSGSNEGLVHYH